MASPRTCLPEVRRTRARAEQLLARFHGVSAVATPHRNERSAAKGLMELGQGREVHERDRRGHLVGKRFYPPAVEVQYLWSPLQRVEEVPTEDRRKEIEGELEGSDDPEVAPAALEAPEEVRVLVGAHPEQLAVGCHHVGLAHAVGVEAVLASEPTEAPAHGVANHAHPRGGAHQPRQPEELRFGDHVGPQRTWLHPGGLGFWIDPHAPHARGVDEDAPVAWGGDAVTGGHHSVTESLIA